LRDCAGCGRSIEASFRYCPWCAAPQRRKLVEFFTAHPALPGDHGKSLRVSRYLGPEEDERHVRFSVWVARNDRAEAEGAVSLDDAETDRLAAFLATTAPAREPADVWTRLRRRAPRAARR
jgi:hypothetical protein